MSFDIIIHNGSQILNYTLPATMTPQPPDYGVLTASVTLIAGILIFLTIDWRRHKLDVHGLVWRRGKIEGTVSIPNALVKASLVTTFGLAGTSILFSLFPEFAEMLLIARIFFAMSVISLIAFAIKTIVNPPRDNDNSSEITPH
jgi:hypothetical protein